MYDWVIRGAVLAPHGSTPSDRRGGGPATDLPGAAAPFREYNEDQISQVPADPGPLDASDVSLEIAKRIGTDLAGRNRAV
jgi:hypothetical protein